MPELVSGLSLARRTGCVRKGAGQGFCLNCLRWVCFCLFWAHVFAVNNCVVSEVYQSKRVTKREKNGTRVKITLTAAKSLNEKNGCYCSHSVSWVKKKSSLFFPLAFVFYIYITSHYCQVKACEVYQERRFESTETLFHNICYINRLNSCRQCVRVP